MRPDVSNPGPSGLAELGPLHRDRRGGVPEVEQGATHTCWSVLGSSGFAGRPVERASSSRAADRREISAANTAAAAGLASGIAAVESVVTPSR
jgi:hypothetical protein